MKSHDTQKKRWGGFIKAAIEKGTTKGLSVVKCSIKPGWSITLPDGQVHHAEKDSEMIAYVRDY